MKLQTNCIRSIVSPIFPGEAFSAFGVSKEAGETEDLQAKATN